MRLRAKLFYNLLFFAILASCVGVLLWQHLKFLQQAEQRQLKGLYESFTAEISSKANSAVAVAAAAKFRVNRQAWNMAEIVMDAA